MPTSSSLGKISSIVICSIGLCLQVKEVSDRYLEYPTQSKVVALPHFGISVPAISTCLRVADVLKVNDVNRDLNIAIFHPSEDMRYWGRWTREANKLTVRDRLKYTPNVNELLDPKTGCAIRFPDKDHLEYFGAKECYRLFNITKYLHRESVCYKFTPLLKVDKLRVKHYVLNDEAYGMIYFLMMNESAFKEIKVVSSYIHYEHSIKLYDALLAQYIMIPDSKVEILPTFNTIDIKSVESPFDTHCRRFPDGSAIILEILELIENETLIRLNRSLPAMMINDDVHDRRMATKLMTSSALFANETLRSIYYDIVQKYRTVEANDCKIRCVVSRISFGKDTNFQFRVSWPDGLYVAIEYVGKNTIIDYIVYVCSCVGIWFGISAFTFLDTLRSTFVQRENSTNDKFVTFMAETKRYQLVNDWRFHQLKKLLNDNQAMKKPNV